MAHVISCHSCGQKSSVSDAIFEKRIAGRKVTLRCTQCREPIPVDGTTPGELRVILAAPQAPGSPPSPAKASPPPADTRQQPKATLLGLAGPVKPPLLERAAPKAPPPVASRTPIPRDEMVTLDDDSADATTLQATLAPVATPPPLSSGSSAPPVLTAPTPELELTPPAVACAVELPPPTSTAGLARDESAPQRDESAPSRDESAPRHRGRGVARVALLSAIPLAAAAALAIGVFTTRGAISEGGKRGSLVEPSALSAAPKPAAAKPDPPPSSAAVSAPLPLPSLELAPPPAPTLAHDNASEPPPEELVIPSYVKAPIVLHRTHLALRRAERCHPHGHAVGTAQVYVTFAPNGRVVDARLEGEPLANAPVARCLLDHAYSIRLPRFKGEPFTIRQEITLH